MGGRDPRYRIPKPRPRNFEVAQPLAVPVEAATNSGSSRLIRLEPPADAWGDDWELYPDRDPEDYNLPVSEGIAYPEEDTDSSRFSSIASSQVKRWADVYAQVGFEESQAVRDVSPQAPPGGTSYERFRRHGQKAIHFAMSKWSQRDTSLETKPPEWFQALYGAQPWMFRVRLRNNVRKYLTLLVRINWYIFSTKKSRRHQGMVYPCPEMHGSNSVGIPTSAHICALPRLLRTAAKRLVVPLSPITGQSPACR